MPICSGHTRMRLVPPPRFALGFPPSQGSVLSIWTTETKIGRSTGFAPVLQRSQRRVLDCPHSDRHKLEPPAGAYPATSALQGRRSNVELRRRDGGPPGKCSPLSRVRNGRVADYACRPKMINSVEGVSGLAPEQGTHLVRSDL